MSLKYEIISIEGNIGSGKSTLLNKLKEHFSGDSCVLFLNEPVSEWEKIVDENGVTILQKFYEDQLKYGFSFQMMAYISRLKILRDTLQSETNKLCSIDKTSNELNQNEHKIFIITERSLYTDKLVFAKMLYDSGMIEEVNYKIYINWFNMFENEFPVHKLIHVNTEPNKCHQRIHSRARVGEEHIPLDYLKNCDKYHLDMIRELKEKNICENIIQLDGNINIYTNSEALDDWINKINNFIYGK